MKELIEQIESQISDPRRGLPEPVFRFAARIVPMVNVDLLVRDPEKGTLLAWREDELFRGWHVPGGIVRYQETLAGRIQRTAEKELGTAVEFDPEIRNVHECIHPELKERAHFISFLYFCRLKGELPPQFCYKTGMPQNGQCAWFHKAPGDLLKFQSFYIHFIEGELPCQIN